MSSDFQPLVVRQPDGIVRLIFLGRKSKPNPQNENESIEASLNVCDKFIADRNKGQVLITRLGEQESGMVVDRQTIRSAEDMVANGDVDAVVTEDVGRVFRNPRHMYAFIQDCVDAGVRFIAIADRVDTIEDDWETALGIAAIRHGFAVPDARRRVKRSSQYGFQNGGMVQKVRFGYRKLSREEAKSGQYGPLGLRIAKIADATPIMIEMAKRRIRGESYPSIADWLNDDSIGPGGYVKSGRWSAKLVADTLRDEIYGGWRTFRKTLHSRTFKTGKKTVKLNPNGPERIHYPELAHLPLELFAELQSVLANDRAAHRAKSGSEHRRYRAPRSMSIFPKQHATCAICHGLMYAGDRDTLKCQHSYPHSANPCWNRVLVNGEIARTNCDMVNCPIGSVSGLQKNCNRCGLG